MRYNFSYDPATGELEKTFDPQDTALFVDGYPVLR